MNCPNCGSKVNKNDDFCENCGAVLNVTKAGSPLITGSSKNVASAAVAAPASGITCRNCGKVSGAGDEFCENCGAELVSHNVAAAPSSTPLPAPSLTGSNGTGSKKPSGRVSKPITKCPSCGSPIQDADRFCRKCGFNFVGSGLVTSSKIATQQPHFASQSAEGGMELHEGMMLGENSKYRITKMIGKGGMGAVFLADDTILKRQVVIKALLHSDDPDMVAASIKEREFLAAVKHPNIVSIYDFFNIGTEGYIVMEFVNGRTLYQLMEQQGSPFDPATAVRYIRDIVPAFIYMHKLDLVYCDFKPQNVMVERLRDGSQTVKLIDLGTVIRYEKNPEAVYGTTGFYAPEAVDHPSPETDLYTICRSLAWMVTWMDLNKPQYGMPPMDGFPVLAANEPLYNLLYRGTHPDPNKRFKSAEELYDQLDGVLRMVEGGKPGIPVISKLFATGALYQNSRLSTEGYPNLDEKDAAIDLLRQGDLAMRRGDLNAAEFAYNQAVGRNRASADARLRLVEVSLEQGRFGDAQTQLLAVQNFDPHNWKIIWQSARLLEAQANLPQARDRYRELVKTLPGELLPLLALGRVQAALNETVQALASYNLVIRAEPGNTEAIFGACNALLQQGHFDEAARTLERVSEMSSRFVDARLKICRILLYQKPNSGPDELGIVSQALRQLKQIGADSPQFLLMQADFYRRAWELSAAGKLPRQFTLPYHSGGQTAASIPDRRTLGKLAEENYREYLKLNPNSPDREAIVRAKFKVAPWRLL